MIRRATIEARIIQLQFAVNNWDTLSPLQKDTILLGVVKATISTYKMYLEENSDKEG